MEKSHIVLPEEAEQRLDRVLGRLLPEMGLRGRRRLCELGLALVNGRPAKESRKLRSGDVVSLAELVDVAGDSAHVGDACSAPAVSRTPAGKAVPCEAAPLFPEDRPRLVRRTPHFAILYKPAAMHTESLAGKPGDSLESLLPQLVPGLPKGGRIRLLNRLDYPTSGLVTAALNETGVHDYQGYQDAGRTEKRYLALLEGDMPHGMLADQKLLLKNRERVMVELARHPDPRRHTVIDPLAVLELAPLMRRLGLDRRGWKGTPPRFVTLAGCTILKGARHQIRAHCSGLGYPLLGDWRYGSAFHPGEEDGETFFLHHACLILPGLETNIIPPWLGHLGSRAAREAEIWMME
jgi:23S rRNA pseudouridine1911/1915/1917 synthase